MQRFPFFLAGLLVGAAVATSQTAVDGLRDLIRPAQAQVNPAPVGFSAFVANAPVANPLVAGDYMSVLRGGITYKTPVTALGIGSGPTAFMQAGASNVVLPTAATNLSKWTSQIHQNSGSSCYGTGSGRVLCASDENMDLIADHATIQSQDASLISYVTVGGSKTTGDTVGLNWTISGVTYNIRYVVQAGDTLVTIASNLASCINGTPVVTGCTVTPGFLSGLLGFQDANGVGYQPRAGAGGSGGLRIAFDQPWAASGNSVVTFLSGGATETLTLAANNTLDNGPYIATERFVPGRTPVAGDQLGPIDFSGQSTASGVLDTQYGGIIPRVLVQDATNPQGEVIVATADSTSAKNFNPKAYFGRGVVFADALGVSCGYVGLGITNTCGQSYIVSPTLPQVYWQVPSAVDFQAILDVPATNSGYWLYRGSGVNLYQQGKNSSNSWYLFNVTSGNNALTLTTGGTLTLGEGAAGGAQVAIPKNSPMAIAGLPTSAGAGGLYVCVDNAGILYKKSACP